MHNDPTVLVSRRPRRAGEDWTAARSWLGGAPCLGSIAWRASKSIRNELEADRVKLARLRPAPLFRVIGGKSKEQDELERRVASNEAKLAECNALEEAFQQF